LNLDRVNKKMLKPARQMLKHILHNYTQISDHKKVLEKYTPRRVVELVNQGHKPYERPVEKTVRTVLFTDLVGFSLLAETLNESDIMEMLNAYAGVVTETVEENGGEIGKFVGDGIMAHFNDSRTDGAIQAGLSILSKLHNLRDISRKNVHKLLYCGVGIDRGPVLMGNIGGDTRKDFTIIGDVVNTASNIEAETRALNIPLLLTQKVRESAGDDFPLIQHSVHNPGGRKHGVPLYSLKNFDSNYFINHADLNELLMKEYA